MRRLHAVGQHEKFVASGLYRCYQDGRYTGLEEHWSIHEVGGAQFIRVDRDGRQADGRSELYEILRVPDGTIERIDLRAYGSRDDPFRQIKVSYTFFDNRVEIVRIVDHKQRHEAELIVPPGYVVLLKLLILTGFSIARASENEDHRTPVFTGAQQVVDENAWAGLAGEMNTPRYIGDDEIEIAGRPYPARYFQQRNDEGSVMEYWLDRQDVLLRMDVNQINEARLTRYARRPESHA
ncbi:MAG TPA: hypothetical protein VKY59_05225 [Spirillospora sp.]|nr:hypothetical protein [Spirillospora sp.]